MVVVTFVGGGWTDLKEVDIQNETRRDEMKMKLPTNVRYSGDVTTYN